MMINRVFEYIDERITYNVLKGWRQKILKVISKFVSRKAHLLNLWYYTYSKIWYIYIYIQWTIIFICNTYRNSRSLGSETVFILSHLVFHKPRPQKIYTLEPLRWIGAKIWASFGWSTSLVDDGGALTAY